MDKKIAKTYPKIEKTSEIKYKFTKAEIDQISRDCFYDNSDLEEIKETFKELAKM